MTSTPTSSDRSRVPPTLESIPTEIKLKISKHLDPTLPIEDRWSYVRQVEADEKRRAVLALSLVSRSWNAALEELKWQVRALVAVSPPRRSRRVEDRRRARRSIWRYGPH